MPKILVVEDERYLLRQIRELLGEHGYEVVTASNREEGSYYVLNDEEISLYLLDVWLPDGEGFDLCRMIRKKNLKPVIFLTACDDEASVVKGLEIGGDDYVVKPFRAAELLARIQANLRNRDDRKTAVVWRCGKIRVDISASMTYKDGEPLNLSAVEYRLLTALMENAGRIIRREKLLDMLWEEGGQELEDNTLSVNVSRLRRKIGPEYIETIRGFGYRFSGMVEKQLE